MKDDIEFSESNPNLARAMLRGEGRTLAERMEAATPRSTGTYPDIVEGSDSERTGTSWGVEGVEDAGDVGPIRNSGDRSEGDQLEDVGSWSTIETKDTAGSPTGNS